MTQRDEPETLGDALKQARTAANLSQDALAAKLRTRKLKATRKTVIRWEKDEHVPEAAYRGRLSRALSLPDDFFEKWLEAEVSTGRLDRRVAALERAVDSIERHIFGVGAVQGP